MKLCTLITFLENICTQKFSRKLLDQSNPYFYLWLADMHKVNIFAMFGDIIDADNWIEL